MSEKPNNYDDSTIKVLSPLAAIRKRPGMYIGDTEFAAYTLAREGIENGSDEAKAGFADYIRIILSEGNSRITVIDNGRGIPIGMNEESGMSSLKAIFTIPHSGGKFEEEAYGGTSGGLHGIGITAANAFSRSLDVITRRDGKKRHLHTEYSIPCYRDETGKWVQDADYDPPAEETGDFEAHGTEVTFTIDHTIPGLEGYGRVFPVDMLRDRIKQLAFLTLGCDFEFTYEKGNDVHTETFRYDSWEQYFNEIKKVQADEEIFTPTPIFIDRMFPDTTGLQTMLSFSGGYAKNYRAFTNTMLNTRGGRHVAGLESGIFEAFNGYGFNDDEGNALVFEDIDLCRGINGIISIYIKDAKYSSQTKENLITRTAESFVHNIVVEELRVWISKNIEIARKMCMVAALRYKSRRNSERNQNLSELAKLNEAGAGKAKQMVVSNYTECNSPDATRRELFIVEGDSASGLIKKRRNRDFQAVMKLKGKVLNSARASEDRMLNNKELNTLITVIGAGVSEICEPDRSRFSKIIITTDADSDGAHIRALLQGFFGIYMYKLIEAGFLYVVAPPLYGATSPKFKGYTAFGNTKLELIKEIEELPDTSSLEDLSEAEISERLKGWNITRYKGLGEMNDVQTEYTILNKDTRLLRQLTVSDLETCQADVTNMMGTNSWYRRQALGGIPTMASFEDALMDRPSSYVNSTAEIEAGDEDFDEEE
ncbi:hypothetical protein KFS98_003521 [Salmonella enterica]|nr:hypothetical protein [Salmonella enterica]